MASVRLKHIHRFRDRHGRVRHYLRVPGHKAVALPGAPGSPEFMTAYQAALSPADPKAPIGAARVIDGSLDALAVSFYGAAHFLALRASSQKVYRRITEILREAHGTKPVRLLDTTAVRKLLAEKAEAPAAANHRLKVLRLLMRHAMDLGWRADDPTAGVEKRAYKTSPFTTWSEEQIEKYRARHPSGSKARLALELLLGTGQRRSDIVRMGPQHVRDGAIRLRQQKSGQAVDIPILPELATELALIAHRHLTWLALPDGSSRSPGGFYQSIQLWCEQADLPAGLGPHGLRKACGVRLAEAGCTAHEIMAVLGHKTLAEAERYTREADRRRMAAEGMRKVAKLAKARRRAAKPG